jgi:DnaJ-domain-containing protein 1
VSRIPRWGNGGSTARLILAKLDGALDIADIAALTGLSEDLVERTLEPLIASGFVAFGATQDEAKPAPMPPGEMRRSSAEISAVEAGLAPLPDEEQRRISELYARLNRIDHYRLLGVAATADTKAIKRSYYALAKLFHPDRFFRKDVGALRPKIDAVFAAMTNALDTLTDVERRAAYDAYLREVLRTRMTRRSAEALEVRKDWAAAAEVWSRVVEALPTDALVHHRHAYALLRAKMVGPAAIGAATRAIELDPSRAEYRITAAGLYLAAGRDRSALAELQVACELEADRTEIAAVAAALAARLERARA